MLDNQFKRAPLRSPDTVMKLDRLGSMHQCRLSFMRTLLRRLKSEKWTFERPVFDIDVNGVGVAVYSAIGPEHTYSLICFGHDLLPDQRSDRVIAHAWDSTFTLFDGVPTQEDIDRLSQNVPKQEAGRVSHREISVSRANRSVRLFNHVIERLSEGAQPDRKLCKSVGYLMRTTAVYGSGKLGAADRELIADRPELAGPFQAEMLSVYLTRAYVLDLVEHIAFFRAPERAVRIDPDLRRSFGIGNSTGLGMAPFIINHPALLNNWVAGREQALTRVCELPRAEPPAVEEFLSMLRRARINTENWHSEHPVQIEKLNSLKTDLDLLHTHVITNGLKDEYPWLHLYRWAEDNLSLEGQEQLVSLMLEPYGELVDDLATNMSADESSSFPIDGAMRLDKLKSILEKEYAWALKIDWEASANQARVWYISAEKLEPRIGERFEESITCYEQPLAPGRDAQYLYRDLNDWQGESTVADYLLRHPEHRHMVRRAQITARLPYADIRDNTISQQLLPIDMLRFKLSFFGASHFDPRSDRWVRINMFQNAPFPHELSASISDDWAYPHLSEKSA
ncbi:MAG: hypothetical protein GY792_04900 [Gammaproteobacteria bacterium]|nr:hypothetical protein [Gammaproteobacteria bacterium]